MGIKIKHNGTDVILEELTLPELEQLFIDTRKLISVIEEQLEYPLLLADDSKRTPDVAGATFALKNYRAAIPVIEQAIAARRKEQNIRRHEQAGIDAAKKRGKAKAARTRTTAEFFVDVAWDRMNEPLFDAFMTEAKKRRKAQGEKQT
jgi:hypothetical protein